MRCPMNPLNYGTLPACQRLQKAGIVLETEVIWYRRQDTGEIELCLTPRNPTKIVCPAPSMAEVWRELPDGTEIFKQGEENIGWFRNGRTIDANPTDTLIDLLIWSAEQRKEKGWEK